MIEHFLMLINCKKDIYLTVSGQKIDGLKVDGQKVDGQKVDGQNDIFIFQKRMVR